MSQLWPKKDREWMKKLLYDDLPGDIYVVEREDPMIIKTVRGGHTEMNKTIAHGYVGRKKDGDFYNLAEGEVPVVWETKSQVPSFLKAVYVELVIWDNEK